MTVTLTLEQCERLTADVLMDISVRAHHARDCWTARGYVRELDLALEIDVPLENARYASHAHLLAARGLWPHLRWLVRRRLGPRQLELDFEGFVDPIPAPGGTRDPQT